MSSNRNTLAVRSVPAFLVQSIFLTILFSALGVSLPVIFHRLGIAAVVFSPMHYPVLVSSLLLGPLSGLVVGISSVFFSMLFTGMPVLLPTGIAMLFELAAYGLTASLIHRKIFSQKKVYTVLLISLAAAMAAGRIIHALVQFVLSFITAGTYSLTQFWTSCFVISFPGIVLQLVVVPLLAFAVLKSGILEGKK